MKQIMSIILLCVIANINVMAQQTSLVIDNQIPGMLSDVINEENPNTVENLKITGYINSTDINYIKNNYPHFSVI